MKNPIKKLFMKRIHKRFLRIILLYLLFGVLWILFSDYIIFRIFKDVSALQTAQMLKGWVFVITTTILLAILLSKDSKLINSYRETIDNENDKWQNLFNNHPQPLWVYDCENLKFLEVNNTAEKKYGYSREEFLSMTIADIRPKEDIINLKEHISKLPNGYNEAGVWRHQLKNGELIYVEIYAHPLLYNNRKAEMVMALDVSERVKAEKELANKTYQLDTYFQNSLDLLCIADNNGLFIRLNPEWKRTLGYELNELEGRPFLSFVHPDDNEATNYASKILLEKNEVRDFKNRYRCKDGSYKWIEWRAYIFEGLIYAVARDITEREKIMEELNILNETLEEKVKIRTKQLQDANKELEAFSYSVSHDLRAPLRAIAGYSRIILEDYNSKFDDEGKRFLNVIMESIKKMGRLIDDLLSFSRLSRTEIYKSEIDMATLANSIYFELTDEEQRNNIKFSVTNLPKGFGDTNMIRQVWLNLISNAIKFSSKKDKKIININFIDSENENIYYISDNGAGFEMEYVHKLFGVFQRLHNVKDFDGTGVGLAIVQRVIHRHGGKVWAEGKPNEGAKFYFSLPINGED